MAQLSLLEGPHVPRTAAREALSRGELDEAHAQLARLAETTAEAADAARLERIRSTLRAEREVTAGGVHAAFASALVRSDPRGFLEDAEWFGLYAQLVTRALAAEPGSRFRGWLGAHFAFAAGDTEAVGRATARVVESLSPGPAWIEAARLAFELGESASAREWIHTACLESPAELAFTPPVLEPCGIPALDAAPALPALPTPIEELFEAARGLEDLPGPWTCWVAVLGEIDRALAPRSPSEPGPAPSPAHPTAADGDAARAFLAALRAARRSRERDRPRGPERCSDRELRARRRMQRLAPVLLARYLQGLRGALF